MADYDEITGELDRVLACVIAEPYTLEDVKNDGMALHHWDQISAELRTKIIRTYGLDPEKPEDVAAFCSGASWALLCIVCQPGLQPQHCQLLARLTGSLRQLAISAQRQEEARAR